MMRRTNLFFALLLSLALTLLGGCAAKSPASSPDAPAGYETCQLIFPASERERTEYNADIFSIEPFTVSFVLPQGWTLQESGEESPPYLYSGAWSAVGILNGGGECVGAIGYNLYELYEGAEDNPQAIYNQIALGNGYRFDAQENYSLVRTGEHGCTARTRVLYSAAFREGQDGERAEKTNWGILSYDSARLVYVAAELESGALSDEQLQTIAESLQIS